MVSDEGVSDDTITVDFGVVQAQSPKEIGRPIIIENRTNERHGYAGHLMKCVTLVSSFFSDVKVKY